MKTRSLLGLFLLACALTAAGDTITGSVARSDKTPVPGAVVTLQAQGREGTTSVTTDRQGRFAAKNLEPGYYSVQAARAGFCPETLWRIEVNEQKYGVRDYPVTLLRPGTVSGFVYDEGGKPIAGARINNTAVTGPDGAYRIPDVRPGSWSATVTAAGYVRASLPGVHTVEEGKETGGVNVTLVRGGAVAGTVRDSATGRPLPDARVNSEGPTYQSARVRADGTYVLDGLLPGTYKLSAYTQGYEGGYAGNLEVKKGETTTIPKITLKLRPKTFNVQERSWVFLPTEKIRLNFNAFRVETVKVDLYAFDLAGEINRRRAGPLPYVPPAQLAKTLLLTESQPVRSLVQKIAYPKPLSDIYDRKFVLDPLPPGTYCAVLRPDELPEQRQFILVTDLGLVVKTGESATLLYTCRLSSGEPAAGVEIQQLNTDWSTTVLGKADASGLLKTENRPFSGGFLARAGASWAMFFGHWAEYGASPGPNQSYLFTERPAYRPEQTVYYKGLLRLAHANTYSVPALAQVTVTVKGPEDALLRKDTVSVHENGSLDGSFVLPEEPALGEYSLTVSDPRGSSEYGSCRFRVLEYRKPEYTVDVATDKDRYLPKETIRVRVQAKYYFGGPVRDADVQYSVYARRDWSDDYDDEGEGDEYGWGRGELIVSGTARTGATGEALLEVPTKESYEDVTTYTVEARVTDASRREVVGTTETQVVPGTFRVAVATARYVYSPKEPVALTIRTQDHEGAPVANVAVRLTLARETYEKKKYSFREIWTGTVTTNAKGAVETTVTPDAVGYLRVYAQALDEHKNLITASRYIWIAGTDYAASWYGRRDLEIVPDKKSYRPGETARVLVNCARPDAELLFTLESYRIHRQEIIRLNGHSRLIEIPLDASFAPNVYVSVCGVRDRKFLQATRSLPVSAADRLLSVEVTADRPRYQPRETAAYTIRTRDAAGKPVPAECSFGLVDEAIYAISPELVPSIEDFFYGSKANRISTGYSFYEWSYGGAMKDLAGVDIRRNFKDTAFWSPRVMTGADGAATLRVELPDNLTTWRATVRAATPETRVGTGLNRIVSAKPLIARLTTPRFLVESDRLVLSGVVHNYTDTGQAVAASLSASGLEILDPAVRQVAIPAGGAARLDWKVLVTGTQPVTVTLRAGNKQVNDGMELVLPVYPYGVLETEIAAGECPGTVTDTFAIPSGAVPATLRLTTWLYPSLAAGMFHNLNYLAQYPYGCVEQTLNRFLPALYVAKALQDLGVADLAFLADNRTAFEAMRERLPAIVSKGLGRLYNYQHDDGGWGWWEHDASHPFTSAYVVFGLAQARKAGYLVDEGRLERGAQFLAGLLPTTADTDTRAFIAFALGQAGKPDAATLNELFRVRQGLNPYSKALLALSLNELPDRRARDVLDDLWKERTALSPFASYWRAERPGHYAWVDSNVEATAWALKATLAIDPGRADVAKVLRYILQARRASAWQSTKDTAVCVFALTDMLRAGRELSPDYHALLSVNGSLVKDQPVTRETLKSFATAVDTPAGVLKPGQANTVTLEKRGEAGKLYYTHALSYFTRDVSIPAKNQGFAVKREYRKVVREKDASGNWSERYEPITGALRVGDTVQVTLKIAGGDNYEYCIIEDMKPSGCEILEDRDAGEWDWWYSHREARDEKIVFSTPLFGAAEREMVYFLRAETPGAYHVLPANAWLMYFPEVRGRSEDCSLVVSE